MYLAVELPQMSRERQGAWTMGTMLKRLCSRRIKWKHETDWKKIQLKNRGSSSCSNWRLQESWSDHPICWCKRSMILESILGVWQSSAMHIGFCRKLPGKPAASWEQVGGWCRGATAWAHPPEAKRNGRRGMTWSSLFSWLLFLHQVGLGSSVERC